MSKIKLRPKQEKFVREYIKCGNASEAYRKSYSTKANAKVSALEACRLLKNPSVSLAIKKLQYAAQQRCIITLSTQTEKLQDIYELAKADKEYAPAISAAMGQAKLHGLLQDPGISTVTNNTQINISADNDLARKVAFMLAKAAQPTINVTKPLSNSEQSKD